MVKIEKIPLTIMKIVFTLSLIQLFYICMLIIPSKESFDTFYHLTLRSVVPEMTTYAALTAALAPISYFVADNYIKKLKK